MQPTVNLFVLLNVLGAAQALLLALALVSIKRGNRTANLLLAAFAANVSILVTWSSLVSSGYAYRFPHLLRINHPFDFLTAPLIYLYVRALISQRPKLKKKDLLHLIPAGLCVLYLLPFYFQSGESKSFIHRSLPSRNWYYFRTSIVILLALVYLALAGLMIVRYLRRRKGQKSEAEHAALFQVKFMVISLMTIWVIAVLRYLFDVYRPAYMWYTNLILPFCGTIFIYAMAYFGLRKPETITGLDDPAPVSETDTPPVKKYEKSALTSERSEMYLKRLLAVMETEKPYTDGDLTLPKLAAMLAIPAHHLSQIINERLNQNFFDFVNTYRVQEARRQLVDPTKKHYSLLAIAEEVGFNSKSAFNTAFKKQTNMTPSEFRKTQNGNGQHV